jgi:putative colanic acid biosynthesis UDP-glucose lipid carrier transferase
MAIAGYDANTPRLGGVALKKPHRKWPISYRSVGPAALVIDLLTILACGITSGVLYNYFQFGLTGDLVIDFATSSVVGVVFIALLKTRDLYNPTELLDFRGQLRDVSTAWLSVFLFLFGALFTFKIGGDFSRGAIFSFGASGLFLLLGSRLAYRTVLHRGLTEEKFAGRRAVLISDTALELKQSLVSGLLKHGFQLHHVFTLPSDLSVDDDQERLTSEIVEYIRGSEIEEVIVNLDLTRWREFNNLISGLRILPLPVNLIPTGALAEIITKPSRAIGDSVCVELQRGPLSQFERAVKRSMDIVAALAGLVLLFPLLSICALAIKLDSSGPIFFYQRRSGFNGRRFDILKFRTMTVLENGSDVVQAAPMDQRVTRIGRWLRRTSIDELPQLINVLNGTMSLVGPRPHAVAHDNHFDKLVRNYAFRHHVKPGLTGWAQVNGYRGPTPTIHEIRKRVECDLYYIDNWTLRFDVVIILRTFIELMRARNAY